MIEHYDILNIKEVIYHRSLKKIAKFLRKHLYLILITLCILAISNLADSWDGSYNNTDGYTRLIRVKNWLLNPSFGEQKFFISNYPFGEVLNWTRPNDFLWLIMSLVFFNHFNIEDALFLGGAFLSPLLYLGTICCLGYGLRRHFSVWLTLLGGILFLANNIITNEFSFYSANHHSFMILLLFYTYSSLLCWLKKREKRYLSGGAFALGLATFVSLNGIVFATAFLGYFLYLYIIKNVSLTHVRKFFLDYTIFITLFLALNPPFDGYFAITHGRLSFLFVAISWIMVVALYILDYFHIHTKKLKITSLLCAGSICALIIIILFGKDIFINPIKNVVNNIWEHQKLTSSPFYNNSMLIIIKYYLMNFIALLVNIYLLIYRVQKEHKKILLLNLLVGGIVFIYSLYSINFVQYTPLFEILPWLCLIDKIYKTSDYYISKSGKFPTQIYAIILSIVFIYSLTPTTLTDNIKPKTNFYSPYLIAKIKNIGGTLLTDAFLSTRYVFEANVNTVSTPYNSNIDGITDGIDILFSENDEISFSLAQRHHVTQILLFKEYANSFYNMEDKNRNKLYWRLLNNERIPYFLEKVPTDNLNYHLYKIKNY